MLVLNNQNNVENINNYRTLNKRVKIAVKKQKNDNLSDKISEMEENLKKNNKLFKQVKELEGKRYKPVFSMKNSQGKLMMKKHGILNIWKSHFEKHLNTQFPHDEDALREFETETEKATEYIPPITGHEVENSIKRISNRKAPGIDGITSELIKAGGKMMIKTLTILFNKIIKTEKSP